MPDKQLTPIQQAIKEIDSWLAWCSGKRSTNEINDAIEGKEAVCMDLRNHLESLLPTEKQFAKDVFDKGENFGIHYTISQETEINPKYPDFTTFYKQFEP